VARDRANAAVPSGASGRWTGSRMTKVSASSFTPDIIAAKES